MSAIFRGRYTWKRSRDAEGNRVYDAQFLVETTNPNDGPAIASSAVGLPLPGDVWNYGNDVDLFAYATLEGDAVPFKVENEKNRHWLVSVKFSSKPQTKRCKDEQVDNPLETPDRVSGEFTRYNEEATKDRFGRPITNSAFEQIRGPQVEFDANRGTIKIEQNVADLQLGLVHSLLNKLNDSPLWGLQSRCIKFSTFSWDVKYYGSCFKYYVRSLEFDIYFNTFDRDILDEGTKAINGEWSKATSHWETKKVGGQDPNRLNPAHFCRYKDRKGENTKVILDGYGAPYDPTIDVVSTCSECADGSPEVWIMTGYDSENETTIELNLFYSSGCLWTSNDDSYTLQFNTGNWLLIYQPAGGPVLRSYSLTQAGWNCLGPNTMPRTLGTTGPSSFLLYADNGSRPGNIRVEKYGEGNLLLLGIPIDL